MKERSILFRTGMAQAILEDRKTHTRRIPKRTSKKVSKDHFTLEITVQHIPGKIIFNCPFGKVGDHLWVKETYSYYRGFGEDTKENAPIIYKADMDKCGQYPVILNNEKIYVNQRNSWKPSLFMPKKYARIWLEITDIRVEELQEISRTDIRKEGLRLPPSPRFTPNKISELHQEFKDLWDSINLKRGYGWDTNPTIFVIVFKRIEK